MNRIFKIVISAMLVFLLLLSGFCFGFSGKICLIEGDIFHLSVKPVLAADSDYRAPLPHFLIASPIALPKTDDIKNEPLPEVDLSKPRVMIYCTHNAESYRPTDGVDRIEGQNAGVFKAAQQLYSGLVARGISAVLCSTIHDYPDWGKSYANSLKSIKAMKEKYPFLEVL